MIHSREVSNEKKSMKQHKYSEFVFDLWGFRQQKRGGKRDVVAWASFMPRLLKSGFKGCPGDRETRG